MLSAKCRGRPFTLRFLRSSTSRNPEYTRALDFVMLEHLECDVCLCEAEGHRADANRDLGGEFQELFAVGAGVGGHAAKFFFVEEMFFVVERGNRTQVDSRDREDSSAI